MVQIMVDPVPNISREFEIDQTIESLVGSILAGSGELTPEDQKTIHLLMMERINLLTPSFNVANDTGRNFKRIFA